MRCVLNARAHSFFRNVLNAVQSQVIALSGGSRPATIDTHRITAIACNCARPMRTGPLCDRFIIFLWSQFPSDAQLGSAPNRVRLTLWFVHLNLLPFRAMRFLPFRILPLDNRILPTHRQRQRFELHAQFTLTHAIISSH